MQDPEPTPAPEPVPPPKMAAKPKPKKKKLSKRVRELAKTAQISPRQLKKLRGSQIRGSQIPSSAPRGGRGKGMAGM